MKSKQTAKNTKTGMRVGFPRHQKDPLFINHNINIKKQVKKPYLGTAMVSMSKPPSFLRAELPLAPGSSSSSRRRDLVFIVNPRGANGRTGREWKKLLPYLRFRLGSDCNRSESLTSGPSHAIDLTREAIREGADAVVAVGGDGTLHEVVNGFFWGGKPVSKHDSKDPGTTSLGLIPLGTGSDFARTFGWSNDPVDAIERVVKEVKELDIEVFEGLFNLTRPILTLRLCKISGVQKQINDCEWELYPKVTALCIGNAQFFGGGMRITSNAHPSSGNFEVVTLQDFKWYDFIMKLHRLYTGTHLSVNNVLSRSAFSIEVEEVVGSNNIFVQSDGEHLGFLPRKFAILPSVISMIC